MRSECQNSGAIDGSRIARKLSVDLDGSVARFHSAPVGVFCILLPCPGWLRAVAKQERRISARAQVIPPAGRSVPAVVPRCRVVSLARTILIKPCVERAEGISGWRIRHAGQDPGSGTMTGCTARAPDRRLAAASKEDPLMLERKVAGLGESYVIPGPGTARLTVYPASCA